MAYKINGTTVVDNSRNVCACCVTSCCITASSRMDAPSGNTASRPGSPATGSIYFDTDLGSLISYNGTAWNTVGGSGGLDVDDLVTDSTTPWIAMTMPLIDNHHCRCFSCCCHGGPALGLDRIMPGTHCAQAECYQIQFSSCRYGGCETNMYAPGVNSFSCIVDSRCLGKLSNHRCIRPQFRGGATLQHCCQAGKYPAPIAYNGYDGSTIMFFRSQCDFGPFGFQHNCSRSHHSEEFYINPKGGVTSSHSQDVFGCFSCCCGKNNHPYDSFHALRYHSSTKYGPVAGIKMPLRCFERTSDNFKCGMSFIVTSDTFGTGEEETCCFAFEHYPSNCRSRTWYRVGRASQIDNLCLCLCPAQTFYNNGCMFCCLCHNLAPPVCCKCTYFTFCTDGFVEFFNKKTDLYGGSNITDREAYSRTICTFSDGLTCKVPNLGVCQFGITAVFGFEACCYCFLTPNQVFSSTSNCRLMFLSRDGCYIHFIKREKLSHNGTAACCCHFDSAFSSNPTCFNTFKRMYYARVNRITGCYDCWYGACCVCFPTVMCCMGCVKGSSCFPENLTSNDGDPAFTYSGFATPRQPEETLSHVFCNSAEQPHGCLMGNRTLEDFSWNAWSHTCTQKAIFYFACNRCLHFTVFDCTKELIERTTNLSKLESGCDWRKFALLYGAGPCYICQCGASIPEYCHLMAKTDSSRNHCCLACCVCAITGCVFQGLSAHCLGYVLMRATQNHGCFGFLPPSNGPENATYINRANDHLVMIRGFSHDTAGDCSIGAGFYWLGAICYDIHNDCISKVNTFFPAPICEMERLCCNYPVIRNNSCCDQPLESRCTFKNFWGQCKCYTVCCQSNQNDNGNHITAVPYGTYQYYLDSGSSDLGGVNITMANMPGEIICAQCKTNEAYTFFWQCTANGCNIGNTNNCTYMCIAPGLLRVAKVPYTTPLECIGWRNDPQLACWMNQWFFPEKGGVPTFAVATAGDACHKCMICCAFAGRHFMHGCVKVAPANNCFVCHVYGTCDCNRGNKEFKIWNDCCCIFACCCIVTGASNAFAAVKFCNLFKCAVCCNGGSYGPFCLEQTILDNIKPCHLDSNETSKRKISRFIQNTAPLKSRPYHVDGSGGSFTDKWVKANAGEDANSRFSRLWHEDVIQCC